MQSINRQSVLLRINQKEQSKSLEPSILRATQSSNDLNHQTPERTRTETIDNPMEVQDDVQQQNTSTINQTLGITPKATGENVVVSPIVQKEQNEQIETPPATTSKTTPQKTPKLLTKRKESKHNTTDQKPKKKLIQDMSSEEINEYNDDYQEKYPVKVHGITLKSNNMQDPKWDNFENLCEEIVKQTGIEKYSIAEACVTHDLGKSEHTLTVKVDDYEDFKIIREIRNWPQTAFGGSILSMKPIPFTFYQNNFGNNLELIISVAPKTSLQPNKIKQCEETYHITDFERIVSNQDGNPVPTNRYKMKAIHPLAYVLACNEGIVLAGVRYIPEVVINHASTCSRCGLANCRASKKKPCKSSQRCMKCSEVGHLITVCKGKDYCINCQKYGHKATDDGHCKILQQKTFDNNGFLIPMLVGEGIKSNKFAILRNAAIAMANAEKEDSETSSLDKVEAIRDICIATINENMLPRISSLENGQTALIQRCDQTDLIIKGMLKTQEEHTVLLTNQAAMLTTVAASSADTQQNVRSMVDMLSRLTATVTPQLNRNSLTPPPDNH